jgi:hypothetical protein
MCYEYFEFQVCSTCERKMRWKTLNITECQAAKDACVASINCPNGRLPIESLVDGGDCGKCMSEKVEAEEKAEAEAEAEGATKK